MIIFKGGRGVKKVGGIEVVREIKYLGVKINKEDDMFRGHKEDMIKKLKGGAGKLQIVIEKSCDKLELGKNWWKGAIVPGVMTGAAVVEYTEEQIKKMQVIENSTYR